MKIKIRTSELENYLAESLANYMANNYGLFALKEKVYDMDFNNIEVNFKLRSSNEKKERQKLSRIFSE